MIGAIRHAFFHTYIITHKEHRNVYSKSAISIHFPIRDTASLIAASSEIDDKSACVVNDELVYRLLRRLVSQWIA